MRSLFWVTAVLAVLVLIIKVTGLDSPSTAAPIPPVPVTLDCVDVPDDGKQHPCMFNGKLAPPLPMVVAQKQSQAADGSCWQLLLTSVREPNTATRVCVPRSTYDAYRPGDTYYLFDLQISEDIR